MAIGPSFSEGPEEWMQALLMTTCRSGSGRDGAVGLFLIPGDGRV